MAKKQVIEDLIHDFYPTANPQNIELANEYIDNSTQLSKKTIEQYISALRVYLAYINKFCNNRHVTEVKPLDFMKYQNWLLKQGLYDSAIKMKRSAVSNFNNYIILFHGDEFPTFRNCITKAIKVPETGRVTEKEPVSDEDYERLCEELIKREDWQKLAYLKFTYISACRKNESRQLLKEVVTYKPVEKTVKVKDENGVEVTFPVKKYKTNPIKCKGKARDPMKRLSFEQDVMDALLKWVEVRGEDDCPYMFVTKRNNKWVQVAEGTFNNWADYFGIILGRHVHPHLLRSSRATSLKKAGKSLESIRQLLGHKSSETTKIYIVTDEDDEEDEIFI